MTKANRAELYEMAVYYGRKHDALVSDMEDKVRLARLLAQLTIQEGQSEETVKLAAKILQWDPNLEEHK